MTNQNPSAPKQTAQQTASISYIIEKKDHEFSLKLWDRSTKIWTESTWESYEAASAEIKRLSEAGLIVNHSTSSSSAPSS